MNNKTGQYVFCETGNSLTGKWHIRKVIDGKLYHGGGLQSRGIIPLCGNESVRWDMDVSFDIGHFHHCCQKCVEIYQQQIG